MGLETEEGISSLNNLKEELAIKAKHQSLSILDAKFIKHRPNYDTSCLSIVDSYYYFMSYSIALINRALKFLFAEVVILKRRTLQVFFHFLPGTPVE